MGVHQTLSPGVATKINRNYRPWGLAGDPNWRGVCHTLILEFLNPITLAWREYIDPPACPYAHHSLGSTLPVRGWCKKEHVLQLGAVLLIQQLLVGSGTNVSIRRRQILSVIMYTRQGDRTDCWRTNCLAILGYDVNVPAPFTNGVLIDLLGNRCFIFTI